MKWNKYPETKPPKGANLLVKIQGRLWTQFTYWDGFWYYDNDAWDGDEPQEWILESNLN